METPFQASDLDCSSPTLNNVKTNARRSTANCSTQQLVTKTLVKDAKTVQRATGNSRVTLPFTHFELPTFLVPQKHDPPPSALISPLHPTSPSYVDLFSRPAKHSPHQNSSFPGEEKLHQSPFDSPPLKPQGPLTLLPLSAPPITLVLLPHKSPAFPPGIVSPVGPYCPSKEKKKVLEGGKAEEKPRGGGENVPRLSGREGSTPTSGCGKSVAASCFLSQCFLFTPLAHLGLIPSWHHVPSSLYWCFYLSVLRGIL